MKLLRQIILGIVFFTGAFSIVKADSNVVIKLVAVNPSKDQVQTAVVKSYLPKEVRPEDVVKKGDLQVIYDDQQGAYFVYGEFELKPTEVLEEEVELRDIWHIPDTEIESLRAESARYGELLKDTEFADRIVFLCKNVATKLTRIQESQQASPANPEQKISVYRDNLRVLDSAKADLSTARSLLAQNKPFSLKAVWGMILAIIIFLGILGGSFYWLWYRQVKAAPLTEDSFYVPKDNQAPPEVISHRDSDQKKKEAKGVDHLLDKGP